MSTQTENVVGVGDLFSPAVLALAGKVAQVLRQAGAEVPQEVLDDEDGVRGLLVTLRDNPQLRAVVRPHAPGQVDGLVAADDQVAADATGQVLEAARRAASSARRAVKQAKRPTAEQRRTERLTAELERVRAAREAANHRAQAAADRADRLEAQVADLSEALMEAQERADAAAAAAAGARGELEDPRALAGGLLSALEDDPNLLDAAVGRTAPEPADRKTLAGLVVEVLRRLSAPPSRAQVTEAAMSVRMLGGGVEVGGSCALVEAAGTRILVDVGARPRAATLQEVPPPGLGGALAQGPVDAVVVTHAHHDHAGWVPALVAQCPVPVYVTDATADLLEPMWLDSARVMAKQGLEGYTTGDVHRALSHLVRVEVGRPVHVGQMSLEVFPAGHILGAVGVHLTDGASRVVVSGDVSGPGQLTVGGWDLPEAARYPDLLVLESTYGGTGQVPLRTDVVAELVRDVELTVAAGGRVLVPAFALGRAQEVALLLAEHLPEVDVVVDGMARDITDVYGNHQGPDGRELRVWSDRVVPAERGRRSALVAGFGPGVVVTTSGMLSAGPVVEWAAALMPDPANLVAVVGYQDPTSPGGQLVRLSGSGEVLDLPDGRPVEVNARVRRYGLGAHASADELVAIASRVCAKRTMCVHGDPGARAALEARLVARHRPVVPADQVWTAGTV